MGAALQNTNTITNSLPDSSEPYVTPEEAASFLHLSPVTVRKMARDGRLPAHPLGNGTRKRWRFRISELAKHMNSRVNSSCHPCAF